MKRKLLPLWVFLGGNVILLLLFLVLPTIGNTVDTSTAAAADYTDVFWGWEWWSSGTVVKFVIMLIWEMLVLFATVKAFLAVR